MTGMTLPFVADQLAGKLKETTIRDGFMLRKLIAAFMALVLVAPVVRAGLYYSGEQYASLPAQWRGFLLDHRSLRNIAVKPKVESETSPLRTHYRAEAAKLHAKQKLSPDELADLGALYVRLGDIERAIE